MKYNINLIPKKETSLAEKVVYFSLNYLRYIIVITQLVVISVFFYRFQIDQRIIDLKESVEQKKEIIQVVLPLLSEAKTIDRRIMALQKIIKEQDKTIQMINYLLSFFPSSITLTKLEIENEEIKMTGLAGNASHLQSFYNILKNEKKFELMMFDSIKKVENGYIFSLTLTKFKL